MSRYKNFDYHNMPKVDDPQFMYCNDSRPMCFAKSSDKKCRALTCPGTYDDGRCPFYKKSKEDLK